MSFVSAGGADFTSYMVTSQATEPARLSREETEIRIGHKVILKLREKPSVNHELFANCLRTVFRPHFTDFQRNEKVSNDKPVV
jgi:hypothetical protein